MEDLYADGESVSVPSILDNLDDANWTFSDLKKALKDGKLDTDELNFMHDFIYHDRNKVLEDYVPLFLYGKKGISDNIKNGK